MSEFDSYRSTYNSQINSIVAFSGKDLDFFTRVKAEYLCEILDAKLPGSAPLDVLDVGCGHGNIHGFLLGASRQLRLSGIDMAADVIADARASHPSVDYSVYDGRKLPYDDDSFDAAYAVCVMHHVPPAQWTDFLAEMRRVVRPGGLVVIFEHNPANPGTQYIVRTCPIDANAVLLGRRRLVKLASGAGLDRAHGRFILFTPFQRRLFKWLDRRLGWLPLGAQYFVIGHVPQAGSS